MVSRFKKEMASAMSLLGVLVAILGFWGPIGYAAAHSASTSVLGECVQTLFAAFILLSAIFIALTLCFIGDWMIDPLEAIRGWHLEATWARIMLMKEEVREHFLPRQN